MKWRAIGGWNGSEVGRRLTRIKVLRDEVVVALADRVQERLVDVAFAEPARRDLVKDTSECRRLLLDGHGVIRVLVAELLNCGRQMAEEDCIVAFRV